MATVRRPVIPAGPLADLLGALHELHVLAGEPSMRDIARAGRVLSYDTVHRVLTEPRLPRWPSLELVVRSLRGDTARFHELWVAARMQENQHRQPVSDII
jgi:hypothetical protein